MKKNMSVPHYIQATDQKSLLKNLVGRQKTMDQHSTHKKQNNNS